MGRLSEYERLSELAPTNGTVLLAFAERAMQNGLLCKALEVYEGLCEQGIPEVHLNLAQIYQKLDKPEDACRELQRLFEVAPGHPEGHLLAEQLEAQQIRLPLDLRNQLLVPPQPDALRLSHDRLALRRRLLERDVAAWRGLDVEPVHQYFLAETRKRLALLDDALKRLKNLSRLLPGCRLPDAIGEDRHPKPSETAIPTQPPNGMTADNSTPSPPSSQLGTSPVVQAVVANPGAGVFQPDPRPATPQLIRAARELLGTRGVEGVMVVSVVHGLLYALPDGGAKVAESAVSLLRSLGPTDSLRWTLAGQGGVVFLCALDQQHFLLLCGGPEANQGLFRHAAERARGPLLSAL